MNEEDKQYVKKWMVSRLMEDGEMPKIQVCRKVTYTEAVTIPADIAIQGRDAIDEYIYSGINTRRGWVNWDPFGDYEADDVYSLFDDITHDFLADTE